MRKVFSLLMLALVATSALNATDDAKKPIVVTDASFAAEVEQSQQPVVLDVYASWCPPCRMLAPVVAELSAELADYTFAKLDADSNAEVVEKFNVQGLPTLIFIKDGEEVGRLTGYHEKAEIQAKAAELFG